MIYNSFKDKKLSALGLGCMRLPVVDGKDEVIDVKAAEEMIDYALKSGVNYVDTAWGYHDGNSELVVGEALKKYSRDSFYLADKFPGYDLSNMDKVEEIFEKQLEKCQVEYFDFYLVHNVCELNVNHYLDPKYGIVDYLKKQRENGRIRHLGFSAHADVDVMEKYLDAYGSEMEFCMLEINYFDWKFQNAKGKVDLLKKWNIPVWVMEPVRGGQLASLSEEDAAKLNAARPEETTVAWAFRFIQSIPEIKVTLTGSSSLKQLKENIATYEEAKPLTDAEMELIMSVADEMIAKTAVPCTACHYCTGHCPVGLDIPELIRIYNEACAAGSGDFISSMSLAAIPKDKRADACIGCKSCEGVCPQVIKIADTMKALAEKTGK